MKSKSKKYIGKTKYSLFLTLMSILCLAFNLPAYTDTEPVDNPSQEWQKTKNELLLKRAQLKHILQGGEEEEQPLLPGQEPENDDFKILKQLWQKTIEQYVIAKIQIPQEAKKNNWEGKAKLSFSIEKGGTVKNINVDESSGYPLLDEAAVKAVKDASPYPFPFNNKEAVNIVLPLDFATSQEELFIPTVTSQVPQGKKREMTQALDDIKKAAPLRKPNLEGLNLENVYSESLPLELQNFVDTAITNNKPIQIAEEEKELARIKITAAHKSLYPQAEIESYYTEGDVYDVDYAEYENKINITHPIYYGGKLRNAYEQAKVNLAITKRNYDEKIINIINETEVAYYTLITLQMNLQRQEQLVTEAEKILDISRKQHEKGLIIPLSYTRVKSSYEKMKLLRDSVKQELEMAYLTFKQVLNIKENPSLDWYSLQIKEFNLNLDESIQQALDNRPEIKLLELNVKYYEYQKKIEEAENKFRVDLTTSYGAYSGHYLTEPWENSSNWYVGFKVSKPLGPHKTSLSISQESAEPRFGQTSATGSRTISGKFSFLSNIDQNVKEKNSEIALLKAKNQLKETKKNITFEVQDAFLKYQKSLLEVKSALTQKKFREEELMINKMLVYRGEGEFPSLVEAIVNLSEAENVYLKSLGNYYISLASLRKNSGYGLKL